MTLRNQEGFEDWRDSTWNNDSLFGSPAPPPYAPANPFAPPLPTPPLPPGSDPWPTAPLPTAPPPVVTGGDTGGGTGGVTPYGAGGLDFGTFDIPGYGGPMSPSFNFDPVPQFSPGDPFNAPDWMAPTAEQAMNEPGYQFRLGAGMDALQNSAAARGSLLTGGTIQDLIGYNQNFAAQEYGSVYDRALRGYGAQYQGARDEYDTRYQGSKDAFAPGFADWQMRTQAEKERAMESFRREYDVWALGLDASLRREGIGAGIATPQMPQFLG